MMEKEKLRNSALFQNPGNLDERLHEAQIWEKSDSLPKL